MSDTPLGNDHAFQSALRLIGDPNRLLPGEEPNTRYLDDARHWRSVYGELLHFKDQLVAAARRAGSRVRHGGQPEAKGDLQLLEAERSRLQSRYQFWKQRVEQLEPAE